MQVRCESVKACRKKVARTYLRYRGYIGLAPCLDKTEWGESASPERPWWRTEDIQRACVEMMDGDGSKDTWTVRDLLAVYL
jgi:hypothetical protein